MTAPVRPSRPPAVRPLGPAARPPSQPAFPAPAPLRPAGRRVVAARELLVVALARTRGRAGATGGAVAGLRWAAHSAGAR